MKTRKLFGLVVCLACLVIVNYIVMASFFFFYKKRECCTKINIIKVYLHPEEEVFSPTFQGNIAHQNTVRFKKKKKKKNSQQLSFDQVYFTNVAFLAFLMRTENALLMRIMIRPWMHELSLCSWNGGARYRCVDWIASTVCVRSINVTVSFIAHLSCCAWRPCFLPCIRRASSEWRRPWSRLGEEIADTNKRLTRALEKSTQKTKRRSPVKNSNPHRQQSDIYFDSTHIQQCISHLTPVLSPIFFFYSVSCRRNV